MIKVQNGSGMKLLFSYVISILLIVISCNEAEKTTINSNPIHDSNYEDSTLKEIANRFGLFYPGQHYKTDSNTLLFYCSRHYDSSFLIQIKEDAGVARGTYFIQLPS